VRIDPLVATKSDEKVPGNLAGKAKILKEDRMKRIL